jgi:hypothetical protein
LGATLRAPAYAAALAQAFNLLYSDLTCADHAVSGAAARALRRLCHSCGAQLGEPVLALYDQVPHESAGLGQWLNTRALSLFFSLFFSLFCCCDSPVELPLQTGLECLVVLWV